MKNLKKIFLFGIGLLLSILLNGQDTRPYEPKVVTTDRLTIEYMDFGGGGTVVINIQGAHNFFDQFTDNPNIKETNQNWVDFCKSFSNNYHVLAPLNRGFGRTDRVLEKPDVKSQVEDLLSWMDYLHIEKALFFGKGPAAQSMLYLAENYSERVIGIVFIQPVIVFVDVQDSITAEYKHFVNREAYSSSEFKNFDFSKKKEVYRPQIYADSSLTIDIPALYFYHEIYDNQTLWMGRIDKLIKQIESNPTYNWDSDDALPEVREYFKKLTADKKKVNHIKEYLQNNNPAPQMNAALKRAFGTKLTLFNETNVTTDSWWDLLEKVYEPVMGAFFFAESQN